MVAVVTTAAATGTETQTTSGPRRAAAGRRRTPARTRGGVRSAGNACKQNNSFIFTVDHHTGSEEHQIGEEYHDPDLYDIRLDKFNTLPELLKNIREFSCQNNIIPVVGNSSKIAKSWKTPLGLLFIDGGHSMDAALKDYQGWNEFILPNGILAITDFYADNSLKGKFFK